MIKIVFMGTPEFSVPILEALIKEYDVIAVITQPDKPQGRKKQMTFSPVKACALKYNIPLFQPRRIKEIEDELIAFKADILITAAYGQMIGESLLKAYPHGAINVHASLLPQYRGGSPIQTAIKNGDAKTGVSIMYMVKKMDAGDIIARAEIMIDPDDTAGILFNKCSILGRDLLMKTLPLLIHGKIKTIPQNENEATYAYNLTLLDEELDLKQNARDIYNHYRSLMPTPVAHLFLKGDKIKTHALNIGKLSHQGEVGRIIKIDKDYFSIATGENTSIDIFKLQLDGTKIMDARDFINGRIKKYL